MLIHISNTVLLHIFSSVHCTSVAPGHFTPLLAERVTQTLKFAGQLPKKTTEMQQLPHQSQAEILGLLLGGHSIQNRTRISSRNEKYLT